MRRIRVLTALITALLFIAPAALAQVKPQPVPVPNVEGMSLTAAEKALVSAGFNAIVTQENVADHKKDDIVLKQQTAPGTTLARGSLVPIVVGRYTAPALAFVPNATGMKADTALQMLEKQGWKSSVQDTPVNDPRQAGMVLQQSPPPGATVSGKDQPVTLLVGKAQE